MNGKTRPMKKISLNKLILPLTFLLLFCSCDEDEFEPSFPDVLIINQPPVISPISDVILPPNFVSEDEVINLNSFTTDQENDAISYDITNSNSEIVEVMESAGLLTFTEVGSGTTTIGVTATDSAGNSTSTQFMISIEVPPFFFEVDFNTPVDNIMEFGVRNALVGVFAEFGDATVNIDNNTLVLGTNSPPTEAGVRFVAFFDPENPLDLESDGTFSIDYANLINGDALELIFGNAQDQFVLVTIGQVAEVAGVDLVLNSGGFNTLTVDNLDEILALAAAAEPEFELTEFSSIVELNIFTEFLPVSLDNIQMSRNN